MALDELKNEEEKHTINGIDVLIAEDIMPHANNNQLDFVSDDRGEGFILQPVGGASGCC